MNTIIDGLKCIDVIGTAASIVDKLMNKLPSLIRKSQCENNCCSIPVVETTSSKLWLNVYGN